MATSPLTIATNNIKYCGITLKKWKACMTRTLHFGRKKLDGETREWEDLSCPWVGRN